MVRSIEIEVWSLRNPFWTTVRSVVGVDTHTVQTWSCTKNTSRNRGRLLFNFRPKPHSDAEFVTLILRLVYGRIKYVDVNKQTSNVSFSLPRPSESINVLVKPVPCFERRLKAKNLVLYSRHKLFLAVRICQRSRGLDLVERSDLIGGLAAIGKNGFKLSIWSVGQ